MVVKRYEKRDLRISSDYNTGIIIYAIREVLQALEIISKQLKEIGAKNK